MTIHLRHISRLLAIATLSVLVSGCFMPVRFDTEIEITRTGYYKFIFDGYIAKVDLFDNVNQNRITSDEENEKAAEILTSLRNDPNASDVEYVKKGHFKIHWEREGDILRAKTVTFLRRNEFIYGISYNHESGRVGLTGRSISKKQKAQINSLGLPMSGNIRVITDANVVTHNASQVKKYYKKGPKFKMYSWKLENIFAPTPSMIIALH